MTLSAGTRLGPYEIVALLGAGGMGEVYRARDTKLGRDVALKLLPDLLAGDPSRLARFEREARTLAALNHPHIAQIYGLDESNGVQALVLELVEGPTLAGRIAQGPIPFDEALPIAKQIAEALETAHEQGIVHRDLKPANIKVRPDGAVKVLDFGLAKALAPEEAADDALASPTMTSPVVMTRAGVILGTAAYMSPEQARGRPVDKRADIWAFGCVVYEMLTGRRLFARDTITDTLAAVVRDEPRLDALPADTPEPLRALLRRCLVRDQRQRLRDMGEARIAIDEALSDSAGTTASVTSRGRAAFRWRRSALLVLPTMAILAAIAGWSLRTRAPAPITRVDLVLPDGDQLDTRVNVIISPDGRSLVYNALRNGRRQLFLRAMGDAEPRPLAGSFDAEEPFFSPDGQWIAFFAAGKLLKAAVAGGEPIALCATEGVNAGGTWAPDGTIVFATTTGLLRIAATGGTPQPVTLGRGEPQRERIRWPRILPGGRAILFVALSTNITSFDDARIEVLSLGTGDRKTLVEGGHDPRYVPTGHLLFARSGDVFAVRFDASRLEVDGAPVRILTAVSGAAMGNAQFTVSDTGSLAFVSGPPDLNDTSLVLVDRHGASETIGAPPRRYVHPRVSPDGRRVLVETRDVTHTVWVYDLERRTLTRVSSGGDRHSPDWMPDGRHVTFSGPRFVRQIADGSALEEPLINPEDTLIAVDEIFQSGSWSPDGKLFVFTRQGPGRSDIWAFAPDRRPRFTPVLQTSFEESASTLSPDGRWLAYVSDASGRAEVYVQPFPGLNGKWQVSTSGGTEPVWARSGREIFYREAGGALFAVPVTVTPSFAASQPERLFDNTGAGSTTFSADYDVMPDGRRFLMLKESEAPKPITHVRVVLNWFQELERLAPPARDR